jgi:hypothetical protein
VESLVVIKDDELEGCWMLPCDVPHLNPNARHRNLCLTYHLSANKRIGTNKNDLAKPRTLKHTM